MGRNYTPPSRALPLRAKPDEVNFTKCMGGPGFGFDTYLARELGPGVLARRFTYLTKKPGSLNKTRGDVIFRYQMHPDLGRVGPWVDDLTADGVGQIKAAHANDMPVVGVIDLQYYKNSLNEEPVGHMISYVLRRYPPDMAKSVGESQLILLEPYDTDKLVKDPWRGVGLKPGWRGDVKAFFAKMCGCALTLIAPMKDDDIDLTKKDAEPGQCAFWAVTMLNAATGVGNLRTGSPDEFKEAIKKLQKGGKRRKTRRRTRRHRRRAAQLTGKRV